MLVQPPYHAAGVLVADEAKGSLGKERLKFPCCIELTAKLCQMGWVLLVRMIEYSPVILDQIRHRECRREVAGFICRHLI